MTAISSTTPLATRYPPESGATDDWEDLAFTTPMLPKQAHRTILETESATQSSLTNLTTRTAFIATPHPTTAAPVAGETERTMTSSERTAKLEGKLAEEIERLERRTLSLAIRIANLREKMEEMEKRVFVG